MGENFTYDPQGNLLLSFPNFAEWMSFCRLCVEKNITVVKDTDTMSALVSSGEFDRLPEKLRKDFKIQDAQTTKKLLEKRKKPASVRHRTPPAAKECQIQIDEQRFINLLLPIALMPRIE